VAYLEACMEEAEGKPAFIAKALGDIARAKGMSQVAQVALVSQGNSRRVCGAPHTGNQDGFPGLSSAAGCVA